MDSGLLPRAAVTPSIRLAMEQASTMAAAIAELEALDDPGARMALARELRDRAELLKREAGLLNALAMGLTIDASAEVDAARSVVITEGDEEAC
jgi:hypothetical protein